MRDKDNYMASINNLINCIISKDDRLEKAADRIRYLETAVDDRDDQIAYMQCCQNCQCSGHGCENLLKDKSEGCDTWEMRS
jgi:hypothetical protein